MTEPFKNADQRIREAFAALRAEIEGVFPGELANPLSTAIIKWSEICEDALLNYAKQPASEG